MKSHKSKCPIAASLDILGDRWTLIVLRDVLLIQVFAFSEIGAQEKIATNILMERLERLTECEILFSQVDSADRRRKIYLPTERGIELIPVLVELIIWGDAHTIAHGHLGIAKKIKADRESMINIFQEKVRASVAAKKT